MKKRLLLIMVVPFIATGCTSLAKKWKSLISGDDEAKKEMRRSRVSGASYNQQNSMMPSTYRNYRRTKRKDIEDDAHLESKAGSLWVMEGQGAYLFSQNIVRMIGDPLAVRLEGDPLDQLSSKASVISKLLAQIEERRKRALGRGPAGEAKKDEGAGAATADKAGAPPATQPPAPNPAEAQANASNADEKKDFSVKMVPTRVIERMVDGNYRVRGAQTFMIGPREYKVIVSGIVRAEDFNEDGIAATQLLDSNFDIVSSKGSETR